jgi:hypothetical protein
VKHTTYSLLIGTLLGLAAPSFGQQSSSDAPASSAAPTSSSSTSTPATTQSATQSSTSSTAKGPDEATLKRAKDVGLKPEVHNGKTMYCWEDASVGSRFPTKKCTDENGLDQIIAQREVAKQNMRQSMTGSSSR